MKGKIQMIHTNKWSQSFFVVVWIFEFYFTYFLYSRYLLVIYFIHISVYMSIPISQFIPPPPPPCGFPPLVSICLFSTSVSLFLPCKPVHLYHFSRFHIYALIYDICFSLSNLLHFVWQSLDPSTSLQMKSHHRGSNATNSSSGLPPHLAMTTRQEGEVTGMHP